MSNMKKKGRFLSFLLLTAISIYSSYGQEPNYASNVTRYPSSDGVQLVIKYDLPLTDTSQLFYIELKIIYKDKPIQPTENSLTGSWGNKITPGTEKVILWEFPAELKDDIDKVIVEVIARKLNKPEAKFDFKVSGDKPPYEVSFNNLSKNADRYSWNFGDLKYPENNLSSQKSPVHIFNSRGSYNVQLTVTSNETNTSDTTMKLVSLGKGTEKDLQNHKKLKTIWLGSSVVSAGIGALFLIKSNSQWDDWTTGGDPDLKKKSTNSAIIGYAALAVSAVSITQVIIQSKKIKSTKQSMSMHYIPLRRGGVVGVAWNF